MFVPGHDDAPEWRATGRDARERGRLADEILEIMRRLWSEESVTFEGRHFRYRTSSISPRPVQQPLPLWIGGHSKAAVRRTARVGTGYLAGLVAAGAARAASSPTSAASSRPRAGASTPTTTA